MSAAESYDANLIDLDTFVREIEQFEQIVGGWDDNQQSTVQAYRQAIEDLHKEAFRRLIKGLQAEPAALEAMRTSATDEIVYAVLRHLELIRPSLQERIEEALESVRPMLASHGGGVELISVEAPDTVQVRFIGACDGCPASMLTFVAGVKKAIEDSCPEITNIIQAKGLMAAPGGSDDAVQFISPFALTQTGDWQLAADLDTIPEGGVITLTLEGEDVLLSRNGSVVSCFQNACAHLGMPIADGPVRDGIIACPHHGFEYDLRSGECLTAPEVQLQAHAVRVIGHRVEVRLAR